MTMALKLLCRVVRHRLQNGEELEMIMKSYSKLTDEERTAVQQSVTSF